MDEEAILSNLFSSNSQDFLSKLGVDIAMPAAESTSNSIPEPKITNIVCSMKLKCKFDLAFLSTQIRNSEYCPRLFTGLILRIRSPRATGLVFHTGSLIVTGARDENEIRMASRKIARIIMKTGYDTVRIQNYRIVNVCGSCDVGRFVRLQEFQEKHAQFASLELDLFPALVYRLLDPKATFIVFHNGKVNIVGAASVNGLKESFEKFYIILKEFLK